MQKNRHASTKLPIVHSPVAAPSAAPDTTPLPTVIALEALWQSLSSRRRIVFSRRAWQYWQLSRRMKLTPLQFHKLLVVAPPGKRNDCAHCTDSCCRGHEETVLCNLRDIAVLRDVGRTDLLTQHKPEFTAAQQRARPQLARYVNSRAWQIFPVLQQDARGRCTALSKDGRCSLHPFWPNSCARFPYAIDVESAEIFYSERCQSFSIHPAQSKVAQQMAELAVAGYNQRIRDALMLAFARPALRDLGLLQHLTL